MDGELNFINTSNILSTSLFFDAIDVYPFFIMKSTISFLVYAAFLTDVKINFQVRNIEIKFNLNHSIETNNNKTLSILIFQKAVT